MTGTAIFWPMGALALLTFIVLGQIPLRRFAAVRKKEVTPDDFRFGESDRVGSRVAIPNRAMMNLLELPTLFYVLCLMAFVSAGVTPLLLWLAWTYVGLRYVHTLIHMTWNKVAHRLVPFALSNVVLIAMWAVFFANLAIG